MKKKIPRKRQLLTTLAIFFQEIFSFYNLMHMTKEKVKFKSIINLSVSWEIIASKLGEYA